MKDENADKIVLNFNLDIITDALTEIAPKIYLPPEQEVNITQAQTPWTRWFLGHALTEVRKAIASILICQETHRLRITPKVLEENYLIDRLRYDTINAHLRKLTEVLTRLVVLENCFTDAHCQLYILAEEIYLKSGMIKDVEDSVGHLHSLAKHQLALFRKAFDETLSKIDPKTVRFLKASKGDLIPEIISEKDFIRMSLKCVTPQERLALGNIYSSYKLQSGRIHASFGVTKTRYSDTTSEATLLLCISLLNIVIRAARLSGNDKGEKIVKLIRFQKSKAFSSLGTRYSRGNFQNGDIVEVLSHIGEVIDQKPSSEGYTAVKVRYFDKPLMENVTEEFLPPWSVKRIFSREELIKLLAKGIKKVMPRSKISRGEINRKVGVLFSMVKFSERDSGKISSVDGEHAQNLFKEFFSGRSLEGNVILMKLFSR